MSGHLPAGSATRRRFLTTVASATAATALGAIALPAFSRAPQRPIITHGVQSGDVSTDSGMVWARTDRPARMLIEASTSDSFKDVCHASFVDALPETDFTAKAIHAGTWTPCRLDHTFGPSVAFQSAASREQGDNLAPCFGLQFFGHLAIDGVTATLTVKLKDVADRVLWSTSIEPKFDQTAHRRS